MTEEREHRADPDLDPGSDPEVVLQEILESQPRFGCLGCSVSGVWAVLAMLGLVVLVVYLIGRFS